MSADARDAMRGHEVAVSAVTVWEVTRKAALGKLPELPRHVTADLAAYLRARDFRLVAVGAEAARAAALLPDHHRDPMDRFVIAQALAEGATVITNDRAFPAYGVPTLW